MKQTLGKQERLKSKKLIESLFLNGESCKAFPLKLVFLQTNPTFDFPVQVGFSVPKRKFKRAVDRNRIKRILREAYRKHKQLLYESNLKHPYVFMILYIANEELSFQDVDKKMHLLLMNFINKMKENEK